MSYFYCDGCEKKIELSGYAVAQLAMRNPLSHMHKRESGGCGTATYLDPFKYERGELMNKPTKPENVTIKDDPACDVEGCTDPFHARLGRGGPPYCSKHYQQARRHERGEGRAPGEVKQIAKPGEGDQVTFKLDVTRKDSIKHLAASEGVDASDLYREAVDLLLAQRQARREAAARFAERVEASSLFQRYEKRGEAARITDNDVCDLFEVTLETSADTLRGRVKSAHELLALAKRKNLQRFLDWIGRWLDAHGWDLIKAA